MYKHNGGHNRKIESWWINRRGYIEGRIWLDEQTQIRIKKHRFIMEGIIGRPLHPWEDVHHKDGNKTNNEPENLELISHGNHSYMTNSQRDYNKGYILNLTSQERQNRSIRAIAMKLNTLTRAAIAKAKGEKGE
jgi:hypothetical protein